MTEPRLTRKRQCGPCTACCTIMGVSDLDPPKPQRTACAHLCQKGCGIYHDRPRTCREFYCLWRYGLGDFKDRPDKSGIVFSFSQVGGEGWVVGRIVAAETEAASEAINRAIQTHPVIISEASGGHRLVVHPAHQVRAKEKYSRMMAALKGAT
jgi:hypothetical protein